MTSQGKSLPCEIGDAGTYRESQLTGVEIHKQNPPWEPVTVRVGKSELLLTNCWRLNVDKSVSSTPEDPVVQGGRESCGHSCEFYFQELNFDLTLNIEDSGASSRRRKEPIWNAQRHSVRDYKARPQEKLFYCCLTVKC